jgi:hypothetical protein
VFLWVLEDYRWRRANRLWLLPMVMLVWVNSHGGALAGFLLWGAYAVDVLASQIVSSRRFNFGAALQSLKPYLFIGLAILITSCINPIGPSILAYTLKTVSIRSLQNYIQEWQSPNFHYINVQPFVWMLLLTFGVIGWSRKRLALVDFALLAGFAYMSLVAGRNIALFALVAPMVLTRYAQPLLASLQRHFRITPQASTPISGGRILTGLNWGLCALVMAGAGLKISLVLPADVNWRTFRASQPVAAVQYVADHRLPGRLFSSYNWGGYMMWALPEYSVFVDGRTDLYNDDIIGQWITVVQAQNGWQVVLDRWQVCTVLLEPDRPVNAQLPLADWHEIYRDQTAVIYMRPCGE